MSFFDGDGSQTGSYIVLTPQEVETYGAQLGSQIEYFGANEGEVGAVNAVRTFFGNMVQVAPQSQMAIMQRALISSSQAYARAYEAYVGLSRAEDGLAPNQVIPIDSGDTLIAANSPAGPFTVTPNSGFVLSEIYFSQTMADKFGLLQFSVAGFDIESLGFSSVGNGTNASLTLAPWVPNQYGRRAVPFLGRKFPPNTTITIRAHNISGGSARFMMALGVRFDSVCVPGEPVWVQSPMPAPSAGRPVISAPQLPQPQRMPRPTMPAGNYNPVPVPR